MTTSHTVDGSAGLMLLFVPSSVRTARHRLAGWLREHRVSQRIIDDAKVVASELIANSLRHARPLDSGRISVGWELHEGDLVVTVSDGGSSSVPELRRPRNTSVGGRGLAIVDSLCSRWWFERSSSSTTVYAVIPVA